MSQFTPTDKTKKIVIGVCVAALVCALAGFGISRAINKAIDKAVAEATPPPATPGITEVTPTDAPHHTVQPAPDVVTPPESTETPDATPRPTPHAQTYKETTVAATCQHGEYKHFLCSACGDEYDGEDDGKKADHKLVFVTVVKPPTQAEGYDLYKCAVCGAEVHKNTVAKLPTVYDVAAVMTTGNTYAKSLGMQLNTSLTQNNANWRTPTLVSYESAQANGGQNYLNAKVKEVIDNHFASESSYGYAASEMTVNVLVVADGTNNRYQIFLLY